MAQSSEVSTKYSSECLSENTEEQMFLGLFRGTFFPRKIPREWSFSENSEELFPSENPEELKVRRNLPRGESSSEFSEELHSLGILKKFIFFKNLFFLKIYFF